MGFHILTSTHFNFSMFAERAQKDEGPRHTLYQLSERLGASIHQPDPKSAASLDKVLSKIIGQPQHWSLAREMLPHLTGDDVIYCGGEDVALPLLLLMGTKKELPRFAVNVMAPERLRNRLILNKLRISKKIQLFVVNTQAKANYLKHQMHVPEHQILVAPEQTDATFFKPGQKVIDKERPLIVSAGLEQRDYKTLANAIREKDIDVKVCAVSPNASRKTRTEMPEKVPSNMEMRHYDWVELRQLYQSADIVVISLLYNHYSAGLTVLMEAMACGRPVIMTKTPGLAEELIAKGLVIGVEAGNAEDLERNIDQLLNNPDKSASLALNAHEHFLKNHTSEYFVELLAGRLENL